MLSDMVLERIHEVGRLVARPKLPEAVLRHLRMGNHDPVKFGDRDGDLVGVFKLVSAQPGTSTSLTPDKLIHVDTGTEVFTKQKSNLNNHVDV